MDDDTVNGWTINSGLVNSIRITYCRHSWHRWTTFKCYLLVTGLPIDCLVIFLRFPPPWLFASSSHFEMKLFHPQEHHTELERYCPKRLAIVCNVFVSKVPMKEIRHVLHAVLTIAHHWFYRTYSMPPDIRREQQIVLVMNNSLNSMFQIKLELLLWENISGDLWEHSLCILPLRLRDNERENENKNKRKEEKSTKTKI